MLESRLTLTEEDSDEVGGATEVVGGSLTLLEESLVLDETLTLTRRVKLLRRHWRCCHWIVGRNTEVADVE